MFDVWQGSECAFVNANTSFTPWLGVKYMAEHSLLRLNQFCSMNKIFYVFTLGILNLVDLQFLVLDEGDTLMDENFRSVTQDILDLCHVR